MRFKRLIALLLALALCFTLAACQEKESKKEVTEASAETTVPEESSQAPEDTNAPDEPEEPKEPEEDSEPEKEEQSDAATPLLYKVTNTNGNVLWLFGSIHVGKKDFYPLPDYVLDAFDGADSLAVEADIVAFEKDMQAQVQAITCLVYKDGTKISDHISQELYEKSVAVLDELGNYMPAFDVYCPAMWSSLIDSLMMDQLGADASLGIDRHLLKRANKADKPILEIESAEFQYTMLFNFSDELQAMILESSLEQYENPEEAASNLQEMMDLWASGDEQAFAAYLAEEDTEIPAEEIALYEEYYQAMLTDRNENMADWAEDALASGDEVFICVGAAHVVGEGALAELMAERGYTVERIAA